MFRMKTKPGRPREFKEEQVLEKAMELFWQDGYHGVGVAALLRETGLARQSLYDSFGNKRGLFLKTVEHYRSTRLGDALRILASDGSPLARIRKALHLFEQLAVDKRCRGCFVANTLVEVGSQDPGIADLLEDTLALLEKGFLEALTEAQQRGELPDSKSPRTLAKALTNAVIGLAVTGKLKHSQSAIHDVYRGTLSMLD